MVRANIKMQALNLKSMNEPTEMITCPTCGTRIAISEPPPAPLPDIADSPHDHPLEWLAGPDRDMTWYEACQWIASLQDQDQNHIENQGQNRSWRMPTDHELVKILPRINRDLSTSGWWIWSADQDGPLSARGLDVRRGEVCTGGRELGSGARVYAVRSTPPDHNTRKGE